MRDAFREIVSGWTLIKDVDAIGEKIEAAAVWTDKNGPLEPDELATVEMMIQTQVVWSIERGDFEPYIPRDTDPRDIFNFEKGPA